MFTGLIEETGKIKSITRSAEAAVIVVSASRVLTDVKTGDSIAVDGACLTVIDHGINWFSAEIGAETLGITTFASVSSGKKVNLERAMKNDSRLGGHMVSGHIDGTGRVEKISRQQASWEFAFSVPPDLGKYFIKKGSVTINGISLTIAGLNENSFSVSVIPHTFQHTNLGELKTGDVVNIETDIIGKYIFKYLGEMLNSSGKSGISNRIDENFLKEHGF